MLSANSIKFIKSLQQKKFRKETGLFVAEGPRLVKDILSSDLSVHSIYYTEGWEREALTNESSTAISEKEMRRISGLTTPTPVLALIRMPHLNTDMSSLGKSLTIALDDIQDPGNLGTIIRLADWFGIDTIFCSLETADAFSPKVVQATMGAIARVKIVYTNLFDLLSKANSENFSVYGAFLNGDNIYTTPLNSSGIIVMGNEGNGISDKLGELIKRKVTIPSFTEDGKGSESLNVAMATAIICSEFKRRSI